MDRICRTYQEDRVTPVTRAGRMYPRSPGSARTLNSPQRMQATYRTIREMKKDGMEEKK